MRLNSVNNTTTFGTRFGPKLARLIENNSDILTSENRRNLANIRNNGIDSVLELEDASLRAREMYNHKYVLRLHNKTIDRKNDIMNGKSTVYTSFKDYIKGNISGNVLATDDRFPVPVKDFKNDTDLFVLQRFNDKYRLPDNIEKEVSESEFIVKEFDKFEKDFIKKLKG